jgi:hypothetical protein
MFELHITYDETTGHVNVNGPISNKGVCYLMLECARDAIKDVVDKAQRVPEITPTQVIVPDSNGLPPFVRRATRPKR